MMPVWWRWVAYAAMAAGIFGAGYAAGSHIKSLQAAQRLAAVLQVHAAEIQAMTTAALDAERQARAEEQRRTARVQEIADAAQLQARQRLADARRAAATADSLRRAAEAFATGHRTGPDDPAASAVCEAAAARALVLAQLLADVEQRGRAMAELADERGAAGQACQRAYESLTQ